MGKYGLHNTPAGIKQIIDAAVKVCPALADLAIERTWAGLRPVTPDKHPVLGASSRCSNLYLAGGYWRNGVLLAPKTAQIVADAICGSLSPSDEVFVREFNVDRFSTQGAQQKRPVVGATDGVTVPSSTMFTTRSTSLPPSSPMTEDGVAVAHPLPGYSSGVTGSELVEMERAALEGMNAGSMLSEAEGLLGKQQQGRPGNAEAVEEKSSSQRVSNPASAGAT